MGETSRKFGLPETVASEGTVEKEAAQVQVILARGMEDLPSWLSGKIAGSFHAQAFDSNWKARENFQDKLARFEKMVCEAKRNGKCVVVIGVSAGAGLALSLMLKDPELIDHLYSCSGTLDPNLNEQKEELAPLTKPNPSFQQMCEHLTDKLHPNADEFTPPYHPTETYNRIAEAVKRKLLRGHDDQLVPEEIRKFDLADKITAYSSLGKSDRIVPYYVRMPVWVKNARYIGVHDHVGAIATALVTDMRKDFKEDLRQAI